MNRITLIVIIYLIQALDIYAQNVDSLIQLNIKARGGYENIKNIKSIRMQGKASMGNVFADYQIDILRPNLIKIQLKSDEMTMIQGHDGEDAWIFAPQNQIVEPTAMDSKEKEKLIREAEIDGPLIDYVEKGIFVEYEGIETVEARKAHVLKLKMPDGKNRRIYIDTKTNQSIKESYYRTLKVDNTLNTNVVKVESVFESYWNKDGIAIPKLITTYLDKKIISILKIEDVELNSINGTDYFSSDTIN